MAHIAAVGLLTCVDPLVLLQVLRVLVVVAADVTLVGAVGCVAHHVKA